MGVPFQCELCHISNIEGWILIVRDEGIWILIRRVNLDTCWGIEPSTVGGDLLYLIIIRIYSLEGKLFSYPLPQLGPFPLEYLVDIMTAIMVLQLLIKPVRKKDYLQWNSMRSYPAAYGNIWSAGVLGLGSATMARTYRKMVVTTTPTRGTWF